MFAFYCSKLNFNLSYLLQIISGGKFHALKCTREVQARKGTTGGEAEKETKEVEGVIGAGMIEEMAMIDQGKSKEPTRQILNLIRMYKSFIKRLTEEKMCVRELKK